MSSPAMASELKIDGGASPQSMPVLEAMSTRSSKRAFLKDKPVPDELIRQVLLAARSYPCSQNSQPCEVAVVRGEARDKLSQLLLDSEANGIPAKADYANRPPEHAWPELFKQNIAEHGVKFFEHQGIGRDDVEGRKASVLRNLGFFNAPVALVIHLPAGSAAGTFLDAGAFLQNILLACHSVGLGACPQFSVGSRAPILREFLGLGDTRVIVCNVSVGWPDHEAHINTFKADKMPLEKFVTFVDTPPSSAKDKDQAKP